MKQKVFLLQGGTPTSDLMSPHEAESIFVTVGYINIRPDVTTWSRKYFCYSVVCQHQTWCHHIKQKVFLLQWGTQTSDLMSTHEAESIFVTLGYTNVRPDVTTWSRTYRNKSLLPNLSSLTWLQMRNRFFCLWPVHCDTHMRYAQWKNGSHVLALMKVTLLTGLVWAPWYYKRNRLTFNHACRFFNMTVFPGVCCLCGG